MVEVDKGVVEEMKKLTIEERINEHTKLMPNGCIEWTGSHNYLGYGDIWYNGKTRRVTRLLWTLAYGEIPSGLCICHKCDNPKCVNLKHLFIGTSRDNVQDMIKKGRHYQVKLTHCPSGHEYNNENTYLWHGTRHCRACGAVYSRVRYWKQRTKLNEIVPANEGKE